jgi:hypothetical protein
MTPALASPRSRTALLLWVLSALFLVLLPVERALADEYTYTVESRGNIRSGLEDFDEVAKSTFKDVRGWSLNLNIDYHKVSSGADFRLILAAPKEVTAANPICSHRWSCRVGNTVLINEQRWRNATPTWPGGLARYRIYVINHEVGHWLGLEHDSCSGDGKDAPVMMQQSKGLRGCTARPWPSWKERNQAARINKVNGWPDRPSTEPPQDHGGNATEKLTRGSKAQSLIQ